jgi:membrane-bound ClpP family serine protease
MSRNISGRLVTAVISTLLEETAIVIVVLWGLPAIGLHLPPWGSAVLLVVVMLGWGTWSVTIYRKGSRALKREPLVGLPDMLGTRGQVVSPLVPEGLVKIRGELWVAEAENGEISTGGEVMVVGQDRLKLVVRPSDTIGKRD